MSVKIRVICEPYHKAYEDQINIAIKEGYVVASIVIVALHYLVQSQVQSGHELTTQEFPVMYTAIMEKEEPKAVEVF